MDEFEKIREFSEDITKRKEPSFGDDSDLDVEEDDASMYGFKEELQEKLSSSPMDDVAEKEFSSMKLHVIALSIFVVVLGVVLVGFFMFNGSDDDKEIVMVSATSDAIKTKPTNAGGMNIPDQDKLVYDRIRSNTLDTKIESLFPEPEKPVVPAILLKEQEEVFIPMEDTLSVNPLTLENDEIVPVKKEVVALPKTTVKTTPAKTTPKTETKPVAKKGAWAAQLMSSPKKETVEKSWPGILAKNKSLLSNMSYEIVKVDIAGKGTFYRLRVGSFQTRDQADALCKKLKSQNQDCIPSK